MRLDHTPVFPDDDADAIDSLRLAWGQSSERKIESLRQGHHQKIRHTDGNRAFGRLVVRQ
jgi:hypothetical protein